MKIYIQRNIFIKCLDITLNILIITLYFKNLKVIDMNRLGWICLYCTIRSLFDGGLVLRIKWWREVGGAALWIGGLQGMGLWL